ncbi:hypothetical protein D3C78_799470 [compost metagenome]
MKYDMSKMDLAKTFHHSHSHSYKLRKLHGGSTYLHELLEGHSTIIPQKQNRPVARHIQTIRLHYPFIL